MSDGNDQDTAATKGGGRLSLRPAGRLELGGGRTVDAGSVRQSLPTSQSLICRCCSAVKSLGKS